MTDTSDTLGDLRVQVKSIDAGLLGRRLRHARQRAGLTQGDAAGTDMSTAYISRIEAGQRRPGAELLMALAGRLQCTPEELLAPDDTLVTFDAAVVARLTLELDYAELELRTGSADVAVSRVEGVIQEAARTSAVTPEVAKRAALLEAQSLEALGRTHAAVAAYEAIVETDAEPVRRIAALTALTRCHVESSDYARAVDIGDRAASLVAQSHLDGTVEGLKLAITVAAAHFERGDVNHAKRACQRALAHAEELGSPDAKAAAYWNTSLMESRQGNAEAALSLAEKAIGLLEFADDARSRTRLHITYGLLHLRSDPPLAEEALRILDQADTDRVTSAVSAADRGRIKVGLARAHLLLGHFGDASAEAHAALAECDGVSPLLRVEARVLLGQAMTAQGLADEAVQTYRQAAGELAILQEEHGAGQLWFELGVLFDQHDLIREAAHAYRSAGATAGLRRPATGVSAG